MSMTVPELLQHQLAALHYRTARTIEGAPEGFGDFEAGEGTRTPLQILRHMTMLMGRSRCMLLGDEWSDGEEVGLEAEYARYNHELVELIRLLPQVELERRTLEILQQGPLADAISHMGQLAMLRRLAGSPIPREYYMKVEIRASALLGE